MRKTILAAVLPLTLLAASGAHAAENDFFSGKRYCAERKPGNSSAGKPSCRYDTLEQCREEVKGDQGICFENKR